MANVTLCGLSKTILRTCDGISVLPCSFFVQRKQYDANFNRNSRYFLSSSPENHENKQQATCIKKPTLFQRFKQMYRDYWYVLVPVHVVTSSVWLGGFYYLARSGVDVPAILESLHFNEKLVASMRDSSMGYIAVSYALYKLATPLRYAVTLGGTTISIQYLTRWGYIKPVPSKARLVEMYQETKEGIMEKRENLIEKKESVMETMREKKESIIGKRDKMIESVKEGREALKDTKNIFDKIKSKLYKDNKQ